MTIFSISCVFVMVLQPLPPCGLDRYSGTEAGHLRLYQHLFPYLGLQTQDEEANDMNIIIIAHIWATISELFVERCS